jgi:hypothetical protein
LLKRLRRLSGKQLGADRGIVKVAKLVGLILGPCNAQAGVGNGNKFELR